MNLYEFFNVDYKSYQDKEDDNSRLDLSDTRKTRLTLRQIQKLRLMNDIREVEQKNEIDRLNKEDREEYLLCFNKMYKTRHLPMIFVGDKMVANGYSSYRDLN